MTDEGKTSVSNKRKYLYIALAIVVSIVLWLNVLDVQNPDTSRIIRNVPIEIQSEGQLADRGFALSEEMSETVSVKISGERNKIISLDAGNIRAVLDIAKCEEGSNELTVHVTNPSGISVKSVTPGKISVQVEKIVSEEKNAEVDFEGTLPPDQEAVCIARDIKSMEITGTESAVKKVDHVAAVVDIAALDTETGKYEATVRAVDKKGRQVENVSLSENTITIKARINAVRTVPLLVETAGRAGEDIVVRKIEYPKKLRISLPEKAADSVESISAEPLNLASVSESESRELKLVLPNGVVLAQGQEPPKVMISVDKVIDRTFSIQTEKISLSGLDSGLSVKFANEKENVTVRAASEKMRLLSGDNISVTLDCSGMSPGAYSAVPSAAVTGSSDKDEYTVIPPAVTFEIEKK